MNFMKTITTSIALLSALSFNAFAEDANMEDQGIWETIKSNVKETWNSPTRDLYVPLNTLRQPGYV